MGSRRMRLYALLAALRVVGSVLLLGMVHPDEFFQSQEVMATHFVPKESAIWRELFVPWEFQLPMPNRSILFPALVAGIPYKILEVVGVELTGWLMLVTPRLLLCLLSFIIDVVLYTVVGKLSRDQKVEIKKEKQEKVLLLFASSWPTLVFLCRPFSNTFETLVLALCFAVLFLVSPYRHVLGKVVHLQTFLLGSLLAVGFFTRFTFPVFFFPLGVELVRRQDALLVYAARKKLGSSAPSGLRRLARVVVVAVQGLVAFLMWTLVFVVVDTLYFHPEVFAGDLNSSVVEKIAQNAVFAPLNNLMYNAQYDNLELHGVHPRFTHLTVNMPMLFGPVFLVFLEPRFMLPALVPLHLFTALSGRAGVVRFLTTHKLGVLLWIVFNLALTLFFGMLHQGGVVPMLLSLSAIATNPVENTATSWLTPMCRFDEVDSTTLGLIGAAPLIFAKTYMPPRFLLTGMTSSPAFQLIDLAGTNGDDLPQFLTENTVTTALFVLPASVELTDIIPEHSQFVSSKVGGCFPHISTEDLALDKPYSLELYMIRLGN
ncbi:hypothetical protein PRIC2_003002 [Phytophthora ramorum]